MRAEPPCLDFAVQASGSTISNCSKRDKNTTMDEDDSLSQLSPEFAQRPLK